MTSDPVPSDDHEWLSALDRLEDGTDALVESFLAKLLKDRHYADSDVTVEDLRSASARSFAAVLEAMRSGGADMAVLESLADDLGARRARQGIPLESLLAAIRLDFSVLWEGLSSPAVGLSAEHLVRRADLVWGAVDAYAARVQTSYLQEQSDLERADADLQHQYLSQLFGGPEPSATDLSRIAGALRVPFEVVAVGRADGAALQRRLRGLRAPKRVLLFGYSHHLLLIRQLSAPGARPDGWGGLFEGMAAGFAPPVEGLRAVRSAALAAREIMTDLPLDAVGTFTLRDRFGSITRHRLGQVGCDPAQLVLRPLERRPEKERERILEAARMFLETGSLVETAQQLFCHRNTVVNRLAAFESYNGLDLNRPRDAAVAVVVLLSP